jgi:hypothetical protein
MAEFGAFRLREMPPTFWRIFGLVFSLALIWIAASLVLAAIALAAFGLVVGMERAGADAEAVVMAVIYASYLAPVVVLFLSLWLVIRLKLRFGTARLAFVRDSLLDKGRARAGAEIGETNP